MTTEERIEKLENELASAKRRSRWTLTAAALVLVAVVTSGNIRPPADEVKARSFSVVDEQGRTRATLGLEADGSSGLAVLDAQGKTRAMLAVDAAGRPVMGLFDAQGVSRAGLAVQAPGMSALALADAQGRPRALLIVEADGSPGLGLFDAQGRRIWTAP